MKVELGEVLTRAFQITWKNKVLWAISALPILASFLIIPIWLFMAFAGDFDAGRMPRRFENEGFIILAIFFYVIVFAISLVLQIISRSSGTLGVYRAEAGIQPITFMDLLKDGFSYFLRVLGISLLAASVYIAFMLVFFACTTVASIATLGLASICLQPLFLLLFPLILLLMTFMEQAEAAVVVDGLSLVDAAKRSYDLVRANLLTFTLLIVVIYFGRTMLSSFIVIPFMIPMFFFMIPGLESGMLDFSNIILLQAIFMAVLLPIMAVVQGVSLTYLKSAMMVTYLRLARPASAPQPALQEVVS